LAELDNIRHEPRPHDSPVPWPDFECADGPTSDARLNLYRILGLNAEGRKLEFIWNLFVKAKPYKPFYGAVYDRGTQTSVDKALMGSFSKFLVSHTNPRMFGM
jgi:hypothetical protein